MLPLMGTQVDKVPRRRPLRVQDCVVKPIERRGLGAVPLPLEVANTVPRIVQDLEAETRTQFIYVWYNH